MPIVQIVPTRKVRQAWAKKVKTLTKKSHKKKAPRSDKERCVWVVPDDKALRKELFSEKSLRHPAKMNLYLLERIIEHYVNEGDIVCDPMCGIGSTGVMALRGNAGGFIGAEYERSPKLGKKAPHYARMSAKNLERHGFKKPWAVLHMDSRKLFALFSGTQHADAILFSPPFYNQNHSMGKCGKDFQKKYKFDCAYSEAEDNIGNNKKYGEVDALIMSPPFPNWNKGGSLDNLKAAKISKRNAQTLSADAQNIDNFKSYNSRHIDAILLSPPFENNIAFKDKRIAKWRRSGKQSKADKAYLMNQQYSHDLDNVGETKGDNYWERMKWIYYSCYTMLKPGGLLITHTKNSVRNGKEIPFTQDTIKVIEALGFELIPCPECGSTSHTHRRLINNPSFWVNFRTKRWVEENPGKTKWDCPYYQVYEDICVFKRVR